MQIEHHHPKFNAKGAGTTEGGLNYADFQQSLNGKEKGALHGLRMAHTPEQAALAFSNLFERPGNPMNNNRIRNARLAYNSLGRNETTIA